MLANSDLDNHCGHKAHMHGEAQISWQDVDLPYSEMFGDTYYSHADGRAECAHVFIAGNRLPDRWCDVSEFKIGELGFGTGLNFLETWRIWRKTRKKHQQLLFISIEAFPMKKEEVTKALLRWPEIASLTETLLKKWDELGSGVTIMDEQTRLKVVNREAMDAIGQFPADIDAWYLDGFSPAKNPDMWSGELMKALGHQTSPDGTFASYTAAGWVRRNLENAGFEVFKQPGFGTKRDMICGAMQKKNR